MPSASKIRIGHDEYVKIKIELENHLKELQKAGTEGGVRQQELVEWYVNKEMNKIDTVDQATQIYKQVACVINKLIKQEHTLVRTEGCITLIDHHQRQEKAGRSDSIRARSVVGIRVVKAL